MSGQPKKRCPDIQDTQGCGADTGTSLRAADLMIGAQINAQRRATALPAQSAPASA